MEYVRVSDVQREIAAVKKMIGSRKRMDDGVKSALTAAGFQYEELGTGSSAYTTSRDVSVKNIRSMKYLNGKYLVVGVANHGFSKFGNLYQGYVKKVID